MTKIELSPHFEKFVEEQLQSGRFRNASDVVEEALSLLAERDAADPDDGLLGLDVDYVRAKVQEALDDPRPSIPAEEVFRRLEEKHARRRAKAK